MKKFLITMLAASIVVPAYAAPRYDPPKRFDHAPRVDVQVVEIKKSAIKNACTNFGRVPSPWPGGSVGACAISLKNKCFIVWPRGTPRSGSLWRHEIAHCNGWSAKHED